jgi:hypothetical protein
MTDMKMPAKAKALLHTAATLAMNQFDADAEMPQTATPPATPKQTSRSPMRTLAKAGVDTPGSTPTREAVLEPATAGSQQEPAADRPVEADFGSFGAYVHNVYSSSFLQFADGADMDDDNESLPSPRVSDFEEVPTKGLPGHLVPIALSSGDEALVETPACADVASGEADQSKRRRLRGKQAIPPPDAEPSNALRPPPAEGFTGNAGNAVNTGAALKASIAARVAASKSPATKAGAARVKQSKKGKGKK